MTTPESARAHLAKAREFLDAAELTLELGMHNAAASNAVTSGINVKDAICLTLTGVTGRGDNHNEAIAELRAAGQVGQDLAPTFSRLLRLKPKAQYFEASVSPSDAAKAVEWATRMLDGAQKLATS